MPYAFARGHGRSLPSLRFRLYFLILLTALPALGLVVYSNIEERRLAILGARADNLEFATRAADGEERLLEITRLLLESLSQDVADWVGEGTACADRFEVFLRKYPRYANAGVVAPDGQVLCSGRPVPRPTVRQRSWFESVIQTGVFSIGEYEFLTETNQAILTFALPSKNEQAQINVVVFATLDLAWLNRLVARADLPVGSTVTVIDRKGVILAHSPDPDHWVGKSAKTTDLFRRVLLQGVTRAVGLNDTPLIYALAELPSARHVESVSVVVGIPEQHVVAVANQTMVRNLGFLVLALVTAMLVGWLASEHFLVRPLRSLGEAAAQLAGGDLSVRTQAPYRTREVHQLAAAFDAMAESLGRLEAERSRGELALAEEAGIASALADASRQLMSTIDTQVLFDRLCDSTAQALGSPYSQTYLKRAQGGRFYPVASSGVPENEWVQQRHLEIDPARVSELAKADVVMLDPASLGGPHFSPMDAEPYAAVMCIALRRGAEVLGFQSAGPWDKENPPTHAQIRIGRGLSQVASLALANASLLGEVEATSRVKTDFIATMSHELRTPCHVILGYLQLVMDGGLDPLTPKQHRALGKVYDNVRELLELVNTTLDLSRIEAGRLPLALEEVSLADLIDEVMRETEPLRREKTAVRFGCRVAAGIPTLVTDRRKLKITLKNLVNNALKFTDRGRVEIDAKPGDGAVRIAVSDTGVGIDSELIPVVFEMFRQGDSSVNRQYGGAGLGLHIVKRMVELLGGTVSVDSEVGRGSTFTVDLPVINQTAETSRVA